MTVWIYRRVVAAEGISLHRSARAAEAVQRDTYPPRTRVEETVLDLAQAATSFDDLCGWEQVKWNACATAAEVARVLQLHGWAPALAVLA